MDRRGPRLHLLAMPVLVAAVLVLPVPCHALTIPRTMIELIEDAEDAVVFAVEEVEGPEYGKKAVGRVGRSFKGRVRDGLELPFHYNGWPSGDGMAWVGCEPTFAFDIGHRYLALLQLATPDMADAWLNPLRARTTYEVIPADNALIEIDGEQGMSPGAMKRFVRAAEAHGAARVELLAPLARHEDERARLEAVQCLEKEESPQAETLLLERLKGDRAEAVRAEAARALARRTAPEVTAALIAAVDRDPAKRVRESVFYALARRGDREATTKLVRTFPKVEPDLQDSIVGALAQAPEPWLLPDLIGIHELAQTDYARDTALLAIAHVGTAAAAGYLVSVATGSADPAVQTAAVVALGWMSQSVQVDELLELASRTACAPENDSLLAALVTTGSRIGEPAQLLELCRGLRDCAQPGTANALHVCSGF